MRHVLGGQVNAPADIILISISAWLLGCQLPASSITNHISTLHLSSTIKTPKVCSPLLSKHHTVKMVCAKCQKKEKTTLITPGVKKKSEMYYGSPAAASASSSSSGSAAGTKKSATLGNTGVVKVSFPHQQRSNNPHVLTAFYRASSCPRRHRIPMPNTPAHVRAARQKYHKVTPFATNAHTAPTVSLDICRA